MSTPLLERRVSQQIHEHLQRLNILPVAAALVFGNTRHTANQPYNVLSGSGSNGLFPRSGSQAAGLLTYTSVFHDYCIAEDPICAGGNVVADHLNYFDIYTDSAAAWVKSKLLEAPSAGTSSSVAPPPATSAVVTPVLTTPAAPYPTTTGYTNGTATTCTAIIPIPTATTTFTVTVPCVTLASSVLSSYTSQYPVTNPTTIASAPTTVASGAAYPTETGVATNGTVIFTGGAQGMVSASVVGTMGLAIAGALLFMV
jgi:hypothetical protein